MTTAIRFTQKADIPEILTIERDCHEFLDPDFDVPQLPPYVWSEEDLLETVRRYKNRNRATCDNRSFTVEISVEYKQGKKKVNTSAIAGAFIYEIQDDGYEILYFCCHPKAPDSVMQEMLEFVLAKATQSTKKRKVSIYVADGDYRLLKFFQNQKFKVALCPNPTGNDAWFCELKVEAQNEKQTAS